MHAPMIMADVAPFAYHSQEVIELVHAAQMQEEMKSHVKGIWTILMIFLKPSDNLGHIHFHLCKVLPLTAQVNSRGC